MRSLQGWTKVSLLDYPGHICSVVFIAGCNLRCPYCHNKELLNKDMCRYRFEWEEILQWLLRNRQMIDGVCFTGGEPTLRADLVELFSHAHSRKLITNLVTNG
ncbi:MAG: radical SAM protein, partial [Pseudothermotoga sp.]